MTMPTMKQESGSRVLTQVGEGMSVFNSMQEKIGSVEAVYLGAVSEEEERLGIGAATADSPTTDETFMGYFVNIFDQDKVPEELAERLRYSGFIRVNVVGFFGADRFVTPDQIESVTKDGVYLRVPEAPHIDSEDSPEVAIL